jgi:hypothetical protein
MVRTDGKFDDQFSGYDEVYPVGVGYRVWRRPDFDGLVQYGAPDPLGMMMTLDVVPGVGPSDIRPDPKRRYTGGPGAITHWLRATGNVFYVEHRVLAATTTLSRIYTHDVKRTILQYKLPLFVKSANTIQGRFLYNITKATHACATADGLRLLGHVQQRITKTHKGKIPLVMLQALVGEYSDPATLCAVRRHQLLVTTERCCRLTPRGRYLLFFHASVGSPPPPT